MKYHIKVILFPKEDVPRQWQFWDCGTATGSQIAGWFDSLSPEARDNMEALLKNNAKIENPKNWGGFKFMQGILKAQKIWQLSVRDAAGQVRLLGVFGAKRKQAILLIGCFHKGSVYTPPNALETAVSRAKAFKNGMVKLYERQIRTDL